jgi:hypothetical protein
LNGSIGADARIMKGERIHMQTALRRERMNEEYLRAKVDLCLNLAEEDIKQEEIGRAIKNLERANSALSRLFGIDEGDNND